MSTDQVSRPLQVEIRNASKMYGQLVAIRDVNLGIEQGEFFSILGPSGGGKTTILRAIAGLLDLTSGELLLAGKSVRNIPVYKRGIGIMFQNYALFPHMTVANNVAFGLKMRNLPAAEIKRRTHEAMDRVQLSALGNRMPSELSGGQQQRVALARAIVVNPSVILLDEPLGALDRNLRVAMQAELKALQRELNVTTICVTHDQEEALSLSDRVAVMNQGTIEQIGRPVDIYEQPVSRFVAGFIGGTNLLDGVFKKPGGIKLADGTILPADVGNGAVYVENSPVAVSIRYEALKLQPVCSKPPHEEGLTLAGTVTSIAYGGRDSLYHVMLSNGVTLIVSDRGPPVYAVGESVLLFWPSGSARLLTR